MSETAAGGPSEPQSSHTKPGAADLVSASLYQELHQLAARKMHGERPNHTLQPTALINEAYLKLGEASSSVWQDRAHFMAAAARIMRHILVDHARSHNAGKRGAGAMQVTLDDNIVSTHSSASEVIALDQALANLAKFDARQAEILELHFFAGMTFEEIAAVLQVSIRTVKGDWSMARAWLHQELAPRS